MTLFLPLSLLILTHCETHLSALMRDLRRICVRRRRDLVLSGCHGSTNVLVWFLRWQSWTSFCCVCLGPTELSISPGITQTHSFCLNSMADGGHAVTEPHRAQTLSCYNISNPLCGQSFLQFPFAKLFPSPIINGSLEHGTYAHETITSQHKVAPGMVKPPFTSSWMIIIHSSHLIF